MNFRSRRNIARLSSKSNGRSKLAVATLKRWSGEPYLRRTYDEKRKRSPDAIVRPPVADRPAEGWKGPVLSPLPGAPWFTVDDIFSLVLVGAYRTTAPDNGGPAWHFVSNYCPARPVLSISSVLYRSSTERDNALFYSAPFLFCFACLLCFFFFFVALFFGSRSLFVAPSRDVDAYPPEFRGSRGTDLSSREVAARTGSSRR